LLGEDVPPKAGEINRSITPIPLQGRNQPKAITNGDTQHGNNETQLDEKHFAVAGREEAGYRSHQAIAVDRTRRQHDADGGISHPGEAMEHTDAVGARSREHGTKGDEAAEPCAGRQEVKRRPT
jgi:hypothetical protein